MKNSRFIIFSLHLLVFSILFYFGNRIVFLFLSEGFASLELADRIMEAINQSFAEIAEFAIHIEFAQMSLLSGFVFGIAYILLVLYKTFDSKNTRPNEEYGSARWGKPGDIRPFIDKKKDFNILLTKTESLSLSGRMKITKRDNFNRNKNIVVVGGAGSGKTRFFVKPNLMQMHSSYVVSDSKGLLLMETGKMFEEAGYKIKIFDLINRKATDYYNPFKYLRNEDDILKIINNLIKNTTDPDKKGGDGFWEKAETTLLMAIFSYLIQEVVEEDRTLGSVIELVRLADIDEDVPNFVCEDWQSIYKELIKGQKEIQKEGVALENPEYRNEFKKAFQSNEYKNGMSIYNQSVKLIKDYQNNLIDYGKICHQMHDLEQQIYGKRKEIKDKPSYIKSSKTFKRLNYKEGFAVKALKNSYKKFYPNEVSSVISTIKDLADTANVKLHLRNEQEMSQALNNLLPAVRRKGEINKQNPNLGNIVEQARKNAESMRNSSVQKSPHQVR